MNPWRPFWFEGNQAWGLITSAEDWRRITDAYAKHPVAEKLGEHFATMDAEAAP